METQGNLKVDVTKVFKMIMLDKNLKQYEVGQRLGIKERQPFNRLLQRNGDLKINEIIRIANGLDCDVELNFLDKESRKKWECDIEAPDATLDEHLAAMEEFILAIEASDEEVPDFERLKLREVEI